MQHKQTKAFLHCHPEQYPLKYDDGRISSQGASSALRVTWRLAVTITGAAGLQVTGYPHNDTNNHWIVVPTKELPTPANETAKADLTVRHGDVIRLLHINTNSHLLTHDVASPLMPTNQEFTTFPGHDDARYNDTLFKLEIDNAKADQAWKTKSGYFKLMHVPTRVALWTHADPPLPEWAFHQQEVNGNKNLHDRSNIWVVDEIIPKGALAIGRAGVLGLMDWWRQTRKTALSRSLQLPRWSSRSTFLESSSRCRSSCYNTMPA
jgi:dolichyl-phosphate-mannose-protein mannosyltransferase